MEVGAHVWLRTPTSQWGWVPARIVDREEITNNNDSPPGNNDQQSATTTTSGTSSGWHPKSNNNKFGITNNKNKKNRAMVKLTLKNDTPSSSSSSPVHGLVTPRNGQQQQQELDELSYFTNIPPFTTTILVESSTLSSSNGAIDGHPDIKLRNLPSRPTSSGGPNSLNAPGLLRTPSTAAITPGGSSTRGSVVGGVHDLIALPHLHEPAILHALRLRYDSNIIYTATGPILIAINPFERMDHLYNGEVMDCYRLEGEGLLLTGSGGGGGRSGSITPFKAGNNPKTPGGGTNGGRVGGAKLPPHAYKTADDAYRAMKRGLENSLLMTTTSISTTPAKKFKATVLNKSSSIVGGSGTNISSTMIPTNQSILVSGESGAGKTVTTKIVLNYFAMLSKQVANEKRSQLLESKSSRFSPLGRMGSSSSQRMGSSRDIPQDTTTAETEGGGEVCIEQQVLQSNPILEAFGNARTLRNDNSSRFGKYIDIKFTNCGKLSGATIETYLLEKVRLIHPSVGERNYHIFYQFLEGMSGQEREELGLDQLGVHDFRLLNGTGGVVDRRDGVVDGDMHREMLNAMVRTFAYVV